MSRQSNTIQDYLGLIVRNDKKNETLLRYFPGKGWWYPAIQLEAGSNYTETAHKLGLQLTLPPTWKLGAIKKLFLYNGDCMKNIAMIYETTDITDFKNIAVNDPNCRWFGTGKLNDLENKTSIDDTLIESTAHVLSKGSGDDSFSMLTEAHSPKSIDEIASLFVKPVDLKIVQCSDFNDRKHLRLMHLHYTSLVWPSQEMTFEMFQKEFPKNSVNWWHAFNVENKKRLTFADYLVGHALITPQTQISKENVMRKATMIFQFYSGGNPDFMASRFLKMLATDLHALKPNDSTFVELTDHIMRAVKAEPTGCKCEPFVDAVSHNYLPDISNLLKIDYDILVRACESKTRICGNICATPKNTTCCPPPRAPTPEKRECTPFSREKAGANGLSFDPADAMPKHLRNADFPPSPVGYVKAVPFDNSFAPTIHAGTRPGVVSHLHEEYCPPDVNPDTAVELRHFPGDPYSATLRQNLNTDANDSNRLSLPKPRRLSVDFNGDFSSNNSKSSKLDISKCTRWLEGLDSVATLTNTEGAPVYYTLGFHVVRLAVGAHQFGLKTTPLDRIGEAAYDFGGVKGAVVGTTPGETTHDESGVLNALTFDEGEISKSKRAIEGDTPSSDAFAILQLLNSSMSETQRGTPAEFVSDWNDKVSLKRFVDALFSLCGSIREVMSAEDRLRTLTGPTYILGDIHGRYHDLRTYERYLWRYGPILCPAKLLFLGDYVDRGENQIETIAYLLAQKFIAPDKIILLRGNHEDPKVNLTSFLPACKKACEMAYGSDKRGRELWQTINSVFATMPVAATIDGSIFCAHGGIPSTRSGFRALQDINTKIPCKLVSLYDNELGLELCWNDPMRPEHAKQNEVQDDLVAYKDGFAVNTQRSLAQFREKRILFFTTGALKKFLRKHNLQFLVRAHEVRQRGSVLRDGLKMLTVHSSIRGSGGDWTDASVLLADGGKLRVIRIATDASLSELQKEGSGVRGDNESDNQSGQLVAADATAIANEEAATGGAEQTEILRVIRTFLSAHGGSLRNRGRGAADVMADVQARISGMSGGNPLTRLTCPDQDSPRSNGSMATVTASTATVVDLTDF